MKAEIISVGTELLLGNIVNTNARFLAQECAKLGLSLYHQTVVGDNEERLMSVVEEGLRRSDILILTGGLGPTKDDLTKEAVAKVLKKELIEHEETKVLLINYFEKRHLKMTENNLKQALIPSDAIVLPNGNGTAPGLYINVKDDKVIILLPGPPNEMEPLFRDEVHPILSKLQPEIIYSKMVKIAGLGESFVETQIMDMIDEQSNPTIAPYAKDGEVHLRVTALAKDEAEASKLIEPMVNSLRERFGENIYAEEEEGSLEKAFIQLFEERKYTVSIAESCSGGLLSSKLVSLSGVSSIFKEGFVTYSNEAKMHTLGVKADTLDKFGAVSKETAIEMAVGAMQVSSTDVGISITGIAGPSGGTESKPVGLVYIACCINGKTEVKECYFTGNRNKIRNYTTVVALDFVRRLLLRD